MTKKVRVYRHHPKPQSQALLILQLRLLNSASPRCLHYQLYGGEEFKTLTWTMNEAKGIACQHKESRIQNLSPPKVYEFAKNKVLPFIKQQLQPMNLEKVCSFKE